MHFSCLEGPRYQLVNTYVEINFSRKNMCMRMLGQIYDFWESVFVGMIMVCCHVW